MKTIKIMQTKTNRYLSIREASLTQGQTTQLVSYDVEEEQQNPEACLWLYSADQESNGKQSFTHKTTGARIIISSELIVGTLVYSNAEVRNDGLSVENFKIPFGDTIDEHKLLLDGRYLLTLNEDGFYEAIFIYISEADTPAGKAFGYSFKLIDA